MIICNDNCEYLDKNNCVCNHTGENLIFKEYYVKNIKTGKIYGVYKWNDNNELKETNIDIYIHEKKCIKNIKRYPYTDFSKNEGD